jgi:GTPase SAR1 family protein
MKKVERAQTDREIILSPQSWWHFFASCKANKPNYNRKVRALVLGPYGSGKSSLINTIYRTLFPQKYWMVAESRNSNTHVTTRASEFVIHKQLSITDFMGLKGTLSKEKADIYVKILYEGTDSLTESEYNMIFENSTMDLPGWSKLKNLRRDISIPIPNIVVVVVSGDTKSNNVEFQATLQLLKGLKQAEFPYTIVITNKDSIQDNPEFEKILSHLKAFSHPDNIHTLKNYTSELDPISQETEVSTHKILLNIIRQGYLSEKREANIVDRTIDYVDANSDRILSPVITHATLIALIVILLLYIKFKS